MSKRAVKILMILILTGMLASTPVFATVKSFVAYPSGSNKVDTASVTKTTNASSGYFYVDKTEVEYSPVNINVWGVLHTTGHVEVSSGMLIPTGMSTIMYLKPGAVSGYNYHMNIGREYVFDSTAKVTGRFDPR